MHFIVCFYDGTPLSLLTGRAGHKCNEINKIVFAKELCFLGQHNLGVEIKSPFATWKGSARWLCVDAIVAEK